MTAEEKVASVVIKTINEEIKKAHRKKTSKLKKGKLVIDNVEDNEYVKIYKQR